MMYCEACGAANEATAGQCFACEQPFIEKGSNEVELACAQTLADSRDGRAELLLGRYEILEEVGMGGFGAVYKAIDTMIDKRAVAIKEIRLQGLKPHEVIDATDTFNREVNILSELRHPNLPRIYDHFTAPEHWYLVMDFIEGQTLATYLDKTSGRLALDEVFAIGIQLCTVLDYLHTRQPSIIFRDLKPTNIMITAYKQVYLIDFGAARYFKPGRTRDTVAFGSPGYASPEQYGKAQTTPRSDIYSLGATLHEVLTGKDPGDAPFQFASVQAAGTAIPEELEALITRMVEMDASKRPASAAIVRDELQRISVQHVRRLYPLPGTLSSLHPYQSPFGVGQPPPAAWASSAPSVQQAQIQLGLPPTPVAPKRGISRRAVTTMIMLGIAGVALVENSSWAWHKHSDAPLHYDQAPVANYIARLQKTFSGHKDNVTSVAWSDRADSIASSSKDGTVRVWHPADDDTDTLYTSGKAEVQGVAWSSWGSYLAAISSDKTNPVTIWDNNGPKSHHGVSYPGQTTSAMHAIAWSRDSYLLAIGSDDTLVRVIEPDKPTVEHTMTYAGHTGPVLSLAWSAYGGYLASASADRTVWVWAANKHGHDTIRNERNTFTGHADSVNAVVWASLGGENYIISGSADQTVMMWNAFTGEIKYTYQMSSAVHAIAWSTANNYFAIGCENGNVYLYHTIGDSPFLILDSTGGAVRSIAWSPDGSSIVVGGDDQAVRVWRIEQGDGLRNQNR